ncbi:MAG TPA: membrane dipeptidase [Bacteroidales bacterium]|nr:membrane dipeptidase [Bacteroidales bacterium]
MADNLQGQKNNHIISGGFSMHLITDGHLDLSMNALEWNRNLILPVEDIREQEKGMTDKPDRSKGTVSFPAMRKGKVGLCVATQIARFVKPDNKLSGWKSPYQAWAMTQGQLAWYRAMEDIGEMIHITGKGQLERHLELWKDPPANAPIGYILSLEGADSILSPAYLERAFADGLRAIGPAHYGPGTYAQGTDASGGISNKGRELLKEMERLGIILDATHLNDESFRDALDLFHGPVWASHNNCRVFVPHNRQFEDRQILELIQRDAVIGVALDAWMMVPGWIRGKSTPESMGVTLELMINNIDQICQLAGNSRHAAIGSDLDGAFGIEQSPQDLDTIADLQKLPGMLKKRGYNDQDIENILSANWIRFLKKAWA